MRFESALWTLIVALVAFSAGVGTGTTPPTDGTEFQAADGNTEVPPPTTKP